jgi:hypothetical protein
MVPSKYTRQILKCFANLVGYSLWVWTPLPKKLIHSTGTLVYNVDCNLKFEHIFKSIQVPTTFFPHAHAQQTIYLSLTLTASTWDKKVFGMCNQTLKLGPQSHGVPLSHMHIFYFRLDLIEGCCTLEAMSWYEWDWDLWISFVSYISPIWPYHFRAIMHFIHVLSSISSHGFDFIHVIKFHTDEIYWS